MTQTVHQDLDIPAAAVVASGAQLYPAGHRQSAVDQVVVQPNENPVDASTRAEILADPGFGKFFTDNVVRTVWTKESGWAQSQLLPSNTSVGQPGLNALHYGQSIFEGLKAYRHADGGIYLFRPEANALRFQRSAHRLALPPVPTDVFLGSIEALLRQDHMWVPEGPEKSLYLRPLEFGSEDALGVRPSMHVTFLVMASPVGAYFPQGVKPVSVWISDDYVRAAPGGTGEAKCAGNYAASLVAQAEAAENGCDQVVWLDAIERQYIEEMGGMNLFFVYGSRENARVVTPKLTGTLLPGVTRDSLLTLSGDLGIPATEDTISVAQWREDCASGRITEVFACGTAAVITPVGRVDSKNSGSWTIADGQPGEITMKLRDALVAVQTGTAPDVHNWMHRVV